MAFIIHDGITKPDDEALAAAKNRGLLYGDGLFETMLYTDEKILFGKAHFSRLSRGMEILRLRLPEEFNMDYLFDAVRHLASINGLTRARVRLQVNRKTAAFSDMVNSSFFITADPPETVPAFQSLAIYRPAAKSQDVFSNLKHCNFLPYIMASGHAADCGCDDALVLNGSGNICDSSRANVFMIKDGNISTPALSEGCVAGIFRNHLIASLAGSSRQVRECPVTPEALREADEIFLTNSVRGIMPVKCLEEKTLETRISENLAEEFKMDPGSITGR